MLENPHVKDADKLISFFSDTRRQYESLSGEKSLISFCLGILNVPSFDMKEIEAAISDLNSIIILVSRELNADKLEEFNRVVKTEVDKIDMWLHGVYNRKISPTDEALLFGAYSDVSSAISVASRKILRDDYFNLVTAGYGKFSLNESKGSIVDEEGKDTGSDYICASQGGISIMYNNVPWTERNVIWTGTREEFNNRVNAKYRRVKDKRLIAILKALQDKIGDDVYNILVTVEEGALKSEDSSNIVCKKHDGKYDVTIKRV